MNEERAIAEKAGIPSPVFDNIQGTHKCYNDSLVHILNNLNEKGLLLVATHNADSIELAKEQMKKLGITD